MVASKEATVYIVDVGKSMGRKENGRKQNNLDWSMQYILDKMTTTVGDLFISKIRLLTMRAGIWS